MTDTPAPRWRVTFRRAGGPMEKSDTLLVAGPDSMVSALKEAQMMLAEKEGGPWVIQGIEEVPEPALVTPAAPVPGAAPASAVAAGGEARDEPSRVLDTARLGDAIEKARNP